MTSAEDQFAAGPIDTADDALMCQLADLWDEVDPVPDGLIERIQFGITLDALEAEIAELQHEDLVGSRSDGSADAQTVTFTSASLTTMVTMTEAGPDRVRIDGWVAPGSGVEVELRVVGERRETVADDDGRFVFADVPHGLAQFILRVPGLESAPVVITPSVEL